MREYESCTKFINRIFEVRVWIKEYEARFITDNAYIQINEIVQNLGGPANYDEYAKYIAETIINEVQYVNAVEVCNPRSGKALLIYPEWP